MNSESDKDKINPLTFLAVLLYSPAILFAVRLGISMYGYLFNNPKGIKMILGIVVTLVITLIFLIIALSFIAFLISIGDKTWAFIIKKWKKNKNSSSTH